MKWLALVTFVGLSGCGSSSRTATQDVAVDRPPKPSHVKPDFLPCDPAHPELPCTPDTPPEVRPEPER